MSYNISNLKIYDEQLQAGMFEGMATNANVFNEASRNTISIVPAENRGFFKKEAFLKDQDFISRMDRTSVTADDSTYLTQGENVSAKVYRKFQIDLVEEDLKDIGSDHEEISFIVGQRVAEQKIKDMRDTALYSISGAIGSNVAVFDASATSATSMTLNNALKGLKIMGDQAESIEALVMHSASYFDLVGNQLTEKIDGVANIVAYNAIPATLNRQAVVSDSPALVDTNVYSVYGLKPYGCVVEENVAFDSVFTGTVSGLSQLVYRIQGQYSFGVKVAGYSYTASDKNPTNAILGASSNWGLVASDIKSGAGFAVKVL